MKTASRAAALAAALFVVACRREEPPAAKVLPSLPLAPRLSAAVVRSDAFDLAFLVERRHVLWPGWQSPTQTEGRLELRTQRARAELRLPFFSRDAKTLRLRARCAPPLARVTVEVALNGRPVGHAAFGRDESEATLPLGAELQVDGDNRLALSLGEKAGLIVTALRVSRDGSDEAALPGVDAGVLLLPAHSSVGFALPVHAGLGLSLRLSARSDGRLQVQHATDTTPARVLFDQPATSAALELPLPVPAGPPYARLTLGNAGTGPVRLEAVVINGLPLPAPSPLPSVALSSRPSVVVFLTDTLRADRLGVYGYPGPTSPALDAFAREGVRFDDAWAHAPWTRPTVASIFTGLHPSTHGAGGFDRALGGGFTTLAEYFKRGGYRTGAVVSNHVVSQRFGFAQGFDVWNDGDKRRYGFSAAEAVTRALGFVDAGPQPFFLYVHTMEPHVPYEPSDADWEPFRPKGTVRVPSLPILMKPKGPAEIAYLQTLYLGEILGNDHAFGTLIDALRARGRLDDTLVLFLADHGEEFGDHGGHGHGHTLYRELTRIPLVVRLPGGRRGGTTETAPVAQVDLLPTLLALAGLPPPELREGRDLSALWLGQATPTESPELVSETRFGKADKSALRVGSLKLIVNDDPRLYGALEGPLELYDLASDPAEKDDLAARQPMAVQYLKERLAELRASQLRAAELLHGGAKVELSDADREELRALGYVQ